MNRKIYAINGSPRRHGNTATILEAALAGAAEAGASTELIHLVNLNFSGCRSCFACKRIGSKCNGLCALRDELTPVLEQLLAADGIIFGSPVYFSAETGLFRNFAERLLFPTLRYDAQYRSNAPKKFPTAFVYTMNVPEKSLEEFRYPVKLGTLPFSAGRTFGRPADVLYVCDTFQFPDYSKYDAPMFDPQHKAQVRETQFPVALQKAREMGRRIAESSRTVLLGMKISANAHIADEQKSES